jgi:hypothetical protein
VDAPVEWNGETLRKNFCRNENKNEKKMKKKKNSELMNGFQNDFNLFFSKSKCSARGMLDCVRRGSFLKRVASSDEDASADEKVIINFWGTCSHTN